MKKLPDMRVGKQIIEEPGNNRLGSPFVGVQEVHPFNEDEPGKVFDYRGIHLAKPCVHVVPYTDAEEFVFVSEPRPLACRPNAKNVPRFYNFPGGFAKAELPASPAIERFNASISHTHLTRNFPTNKTLTF